MNLTGKNVQFRQQRLKSSPTIALVLICVVVASLFLLRAVVVTQQIRSPFLPTPTPTRIALSHAQEGETLFLAGNLPSAILAYREAVQQDPQNVDLMVELTRIQVYSSAMMSTDLEKRTRLEEARATIDAALKLAPENSNVHAVRALTLDWYANPNLSGEQWEKYLVQADQEAVQAMNLDEKNPLAKAYYAEVLVDEKKWLQADQAIQQALELTRLMPDSDSQKVLMDVHRVNAYVQETLGNYKKAINEYGEAAKVTPNLTFLYINSGINSRQLKEYDQALEMFSKAVVINQQLGIKDPLPYLAIGKVYSQTGDFFAAAQNVRKALTINPTNQDVYGSLGVIYFKSRSYENAIDALQCSVRGCDAKLSCKVRNRGQDCKPEQLVDPIVIAGLPLSGSTVVYYFTYGSVLAGMHRESQPYCKEAVKVLGEVRAKYSSDITIMTIIEPSERICAGYGYNE